MRKKIIISNKNVKLNTSRIGGASRLPKNIQFPLTTLEQEQKADVSLKFLFSISLTDLGFIQNRYKDYVCSVFFALDIKDYEHISIMQDYYKNEYIGSVVIIHKDEDYNREDAFFEPPKQIIVEESKNEWLQDEIKWEGYSCFLEIDLLQIDEHSNMEGFFDDSYGYLFIKDDWKINENCGAFLLQST